MAEKIIKLASFPYQGPDGGERTALRGDRVNITEHTDLERGDRLGVFATAADLEAGTVFGDFYLAKQANEKAATDAGMPALAMTPDDSGSTDEDPPGPEKPAVNASRDKWAEYAKAMGAPDSELVPGDQGGLTRDQLRDKYGN
jgi:hypothetical protein